MREAHAQMRRTPDGLTPPLFAYEQPSPQELVLLYDSPRQLCAVLLEAAERYGEQVQVKERSCMKRGEQACRFELRFHATSVPQPVDSPEQRERKEQQRKRLTHVWQALPTHNGVTLMQLCQHLQQRPSLVLEALQHLQHTGLVSTTATEPGDSLTTRRYWRTPTAD